MWSCAALRELTHIADVIFKEKLFRSVKLVCREATDCYGLVFKCVQMDLYETFETARCRAESVLCYYMLIYVQNITVKETQKKIMKIEFGAISQRASGNIFFLRNAAV